MSQLHSIMKLKGLFFALLLGGIGFSSCKKKCVIEKENTDSGAIISESSTGEDVVIYHIGYMYPGLGNHIFQGHDYADKVEVSFDNGQTKGPVNYSQYHVLRNPVWVSCEAQFDREVLFNAVTQTVTYKLHVTNCGSCDEQYFAENYVLVPAIPNGYTVLYDVSYTEVD